MGIRATPAVERLRAARTRRERGRIAKQWPGVVLSFYGDGPRWRNAIELPAYPPGFSFPRPFRYRDTWIETELLDAMRRNPDGFEGLEVLLAMRFKSPDLGFVPLRRARISSAEISPDNSFINFSAGDLFAISDEISDLRDLAQPIPDSARNALCFSASPSGLESESEGAESELSRWTSLVDLLAATSLPLDCRAKRAVYMHISTPRGWRVSKADVVDRSRTSGFRYGLRLKEASEREATLVHRVPCMIGSEESAPDFLIGVGSSSQSVAVTPAKAEISSNYGRYLLSLVGIRAENAWADLEIGDSSEHPAPQGHEVTRLQIPVRTVFGAWHRFWTLLVPFLLLLGAFLANALVTNYKTFEDDVTKLLVVAGISAGASGIIVIFKR